MTDFRVARIEDVKDGHGIAVDVGAKRIAIFRDGDEYFALDETCPHRGGPLHAGAVDGGVVLCPWHQWQFDLRSGCSPVNPLSRVERYSVRIADGALWVDVGSS